MKRPLVLLEFEEVVDRPRRATEGMNGIDSLISTKSLIVYQYLKCASQARITFIKRTRSVPECLECWSTSQTWSYMILIISGKHDMYD